MQAVGVDGEVAEEGSFVSFEPKGLPYSSIASGDHDILWDEAVSIVASDPEKVFQFGVNYASGKYSKPKGLAQLTTSHKTAMAQNRERNDRQAVLLWQLAADQDHANSQYNLGVMYETGRGTETGNRDLTLAASFYTLASNQGHTSAKCNLGAMFEYGEGVPKNEEKALQLYTQAAEQGSIKATFNLALMYQDARGTPHQDITKALELYQWAADRGHAKSQFNLGVLYQKGLGVLPDPKRTIFWWKKAAAQRNRNAMFNLGKAFEQGVGVVQDHATAMQWYHEAAKEGDPNAKKRLAEQGEAVANATVPPGEGGGKGVVSNFFDPPAAAAASSPGCGGGRPSSLVRRMSGRAMATAEKWLFSPSPEARTRAPSVSAVPPPQPQPSPPHPRRASTASTGTGGHVASSPSRSGADDVDLLGLGPAVQAPTAPPTSSSSVDTAASTHLPWSEVAPTAAIAATTASTRSPPLTAAVIPLLPKPR